LDGGDNEKEPKRRQTRVVWAIGEFFSFCCVFLILTNVLFYIQVIIYIIHDEETVTTTRKSPNDMRRASFGP
jgi:hypothetical protein